MNTNDVTAHFIPTKLVLNLSCTQNSIGHTSLVIRKPSFSICENKDADQLRSNREPDQRLCFRYMDRTIPLLPKHEIPSLQPSSAAVQPGLCRTWSETPKTDFLTKRLIHADNVWINPKNQASRNTIRKLQYDHSP